MSRARGPIKYTCPDIDSSITTLNHILSDLKNYQLESKNPSFKEDCNNWINDLSEICEGQNCLLENLRSANDELRCWGSEKEDDSISLERNVEELESKIQDLEFELLEAKDALKEITTNY